MNVSDMKLCEGEIQVAVHHSQKTPCDFKCKLTTIATRTLTFLGVMQKQRLCARKLRAWRDQRDARHLGATGVALHLTAKIQESVFLETKKDVGESSVTK